MPNNPFQLAAAAAAAGLPVNVPNATPNLKDNHTTFPFFRPPQNVMEQVTQTQQALLNMMRTAQQSQQLKDLKRQAPPATQQLQKQLTSQLSQQLTKKDDALDLSSGSPSPKRVRRNSGENNEQNMATLSMCNLVTPCSHEAKEVRAWSVDDVCKFVSTIDHCQPFVEVRLI